MSMLFIGPGCDLETEVLSGWWMSREISVNADESLLPDTGFSLVLGHFGPDVAGVVRMVKGQFEAGDFKGHNRQPLQSCPCSFVENGYYREGMFTFRIERSEGCTLLDELSTNALILSLELTEENVLEGTLETQDGENVQPIRFVRDEDADFVGEADKQCQND
jgi:hypothetical protein